MRRPAPDIDEVPIALLAEPLQWFLAEHERHRQMCRLVDELAVDPKPRRARLQCAVDFLRTELPMHVRDEEEDLFPLLRRRCEPIDDIERILGALQADHRQDVVTAAGVRRQLEAAIADGASPRSHPGVTETLQTFARQERHHLALENAVILPIARLRLTDADLRGLGRRIAARRKLNLPKAD